FVLFVILNFVLFVILNLFQDLSPRQLEMLK
ncbi:MAG: hypothetical protein AVDCRST_MAG96-1958, partial [uncultured Segetibacter sp.]